MQAGWYERPGPARDVLIVGAMPIPEPGRGELRFRVAASGVNPGDVKKRQDAFGLGMPYPRVIPHSDGAGTVDAIGEDVDPVWLGQNIWCFGAQSYRPFGTAAEYCVIPVDNAVVAPPSMQPAHGACLGIPGLTAHRAVHVAGRVKRKNILVQGGAGAVGICAVQLAHLAGARVVATVRSEDDVRLASGAGADHVLVTGPDLAGRMKDVVPEGVDHIVEVAFAANIALDVELLRDGGTIASFATNRPEATISVWPLVFKNVGMFFLGSDDFPLPAKRAAADALNAAFEAGWTGFDSVQRFSLSEIVAAHEWMERPPSRARVVIEP